MRKKATGRHRRQYRRQQASAGSWQTVTPRRLAVEEATVNVSHQQKGLTGACVCPSKEPCTLYSSTDCVAVANSLILAAGQSVCWQTLGWVLDVMVL